MSQVKPGFRADRLNLRLYLKVWRWHFYAGLFVLPFLMMLSVTGLVYLFKNEILQSTYGAWMHVTPVADPLPLERLEGLASQALDGAVFTKVRPSDSPGRTAEFQFKDREGSLTTAFVHPGTGAVLGTRNDDETLPAWAVKVHGELLLGPWGDRLIELAASWTMVLVASGLYLWWPRAAPGSRPTGWARLGGILFVRGFATRRTSRVFWRDLHAVTGVWISALLVFFVFTGLFWTGFWGDQLAKPWSHFPTALWSAPPTSARPQASLNTTSEKVVPWAVESLPLPTSGHHGIGQDKDSQHESPETRGHAHHVAPTGPTAPSAPVTPLTRISLDEALAAARRHGLEGPWTLSLPTAPDGVFTVVRESDDPRGEATLHVDQYSGAVLADIRWEHYGPLAKGVSSGIALHEGRLFGAWNKALAALACVLILVCSGAAAVLWWRRAPAFRNLAAPSRVVLPTTPWAGLALLVALCLAFPLAGLSLVCVVVFDQCVLKRVPVLKRMVG